jgi:hypothetical protein
MASLKGDQPKVRTTKVSEMAAFAGKSDQTIRRWKEMPGFPVDPRDNSVCLWDLAVWRHSIDNIGCDGIPDDIDGPDSPALERFRLARAQQEEIKLESMRGDFLPREDAKTMLLEIASIYRSAGEILVRNFGNDAGDVINDALDEASRRFEQRWGHDRTGAEVGERDA